MERDHQKYTPQWIIYGKINELHCAKDVLTMFNCMFSCSLIPDAEAELASL